MCYHFIGFCSLPTNGGVNVIKSKQLVLCYRYISWDNNTTTTQLDITLVDMPLHLAIETCIPKNNITNVWES